MSLWVPQLRSRCGTSPGMPLPLNCKRLAGAAPPCPARTRCELDPPQRRRRSAPLIFSRNSLTRSALRIQGRALNPCPRRTAAGRATLSALLAALALLDAAGARQANTVSVRSTRGHEAERCFGP